MTGGQTMPPKECQQCERHASKHPDLFALLNDPQQINVQILLCRPCKVEWGDEGLDPAFFD
jgi:hypothetical protein